MIPKSTGANTICAMESIILTREISTHAPAISHVRQGVTTGASKVVAMVMATDSATSPLAK